MTARRTLEVKALTRVEGEGRLYVRLDGDVVEQVELNIYEPPRFFESFLRGREPREVPDIVARICGICPVAYQMSACHALEKALSITVTPEIRALRRLLYCGEWIESHVLHVHLLHAPDFLGYESGITMAADHRAAVERGLRLKKIGNRLVEILGGRAIHPINVAVGGFHRAPSKVELKALLPDLEWGLGASIEALRWVAAFEFPDFRTDGPDISLRHPDEYPMNDGRIVASSGLDIAAEEFERHFQEHQVPHSTALHSVLLPDLASYLVGPLARVNNCLDKLPPIARREAENSQVAWPARNTFHSIVARMIEVVAAFETAVELVRLYQAEPSVSCVAWQPRAGEGRHATEAPRGLIYHRYRVGEDGLIAEARIVPPTSQNQGRIEADLRNFVPRVAHLNDAAATRECENLVRNFDPCISCATHFLTVTIDRRA